MRILVLILLAALAAAQDPKPEASELSPLQRQGAAMRVLRDRRAEQEEVQLAVEELLAISADSCVLLGRHLERVLKKERSTNERGQRDLMGAFLSSAKAFMAKRLEGEAQVEVDRARSVVLKNARSKNLSKEDIKKVSQPALEALQKLLLLKSAEVWLADEDLFDEWVVFLDALDLEAQHYAWMQDTRAALVARGEDWKASGFKDQGDPGGYEAQLQAFLEWEVVLITPMTLKDRSILNANRALRPKQIKPGDMAGDAPPSNAPGPGKGSRRNPVEIKPAMPALSQKECDGLFAHNQLRILLGLNAVHADLRLCAAARDHSQDMVRLGFFAHSSPVPGRETPWKRAAARGTSAGGENIAAGQSSGEGAIRAWWFSPGHHKNMLGSSTRCGLGHHQNHWTQLLGG